MRTLRPSLIATIIFALLGGLGGAVAAQEDVVPQTPAWVSGQVTDMEFISQVRETIVDGRVRAIGDTWNFEQSVSDPRLAGPVLFVNTSDALTSQDDSQLFVGTVAIENEGGSWQGRHVGFRGPGLPWAHNMQVELVGQGGYEGLQALLFYEGRLGFDSLEGLIFEGGLPPMPE